ncbi:MAG TPA: BatD family protein [bacterium]|jgi:hypothetical protein|nr:BatD family protein [bacterium]
MRVNTQLSFFILFAAISYAANAQPLKVTTTVDRTTVALNQRLALTVTLSGDGAQKVERPSPPDLGEALRLLGAGGTSQNIQLMNGKMSVEMSSTFYYIAAKEGRFTIPPIKAVYQNTEYASNPIDIEIVASSQQPSTPVTPPGEQTDLSELLFVRTLVNKSRVYQNEPVVVTYRIHTQVNVAGYALSQLPETTGFWVEDIESQAVTREEEYRGKRYTVADIKKMAAFPTSPGVKTIGALAMTCEVRLQNRRRSRDIFDSIFEDPFFTRTVKQEVFAPAVKVEVMPLPEENKPANFSGAVGSFTLDASVDRREVKANEAVTLTVKIAGQGNIKILPTPALQLPADFTSYDPTISQTVQANDRGVRGSKTFEYVLIPRFPGEKKIKSIEFAYFDPQKGEYQVLKTPEITLSVAKGDQEILSVGSGLSKEDVQLIGRDIRFLKLQSSRFESINRQVYLRPLYLLVIILAALCLLGVAGYQRYSDKLNENQALARSKKASRTVRKRLHSAHQALKADEGVAFYGELSRALLGYISDKLNLAEAGVVSQELEKLLTERQVGKELVAELLRILQICDYYRFGLGQTDKKEMEAVYQQAKTLLVKLGRSKPL